MRAAEARGRTAEEAIAAAVAQLGVPRQQVKVEVLEEASRGLFGLLGTRDARVRVTWSPSKVEAAVDWVRHVAAGMGLQADVSAREDGDHLFVDVAGQELGALIGHHGKTLDAVQYLVNLAAFKASGDQARIVLDVEGYRKRRAEVLQRVAERAAERVARTGWPIELEPMSAHERRVVHLALQHHPRIVTRSAGEEPYRKVVIERRP